MRRTLLTIIFIAVSAILFSQDGVSLRMNKQLQLTTDTETGIYTCSVAENENGIFEVVARYNDGVIRMKGSYLDKNLEVEEGLFEYFYFNGRIESKGEFIGGVKSGPWKRWDIQGEEKASRIYPGISAEEISEKYETRLAQFPGGHEALAKYIQDNLEYPEEAKRLEIEGDVDIAFTINIRGELVNLEIMNNVHYYLDTEALRLVKNMPNWIPAKKRGNVIPAKFILPITFRVAQFQASEQ